MKISLKEWKTIEGHLRAMHKLIEITDSKISSIMFEHHGAGNTAEAELLRELSDKVHELRGVSNFNGGVHPQSEWMGGNSDSPENHKLREPNCCPAPRRYFTPEEMAEAGAENHGPVSWSFNPPTEGAELVPGDSGG